MEVQEGTLRSQDCQWRWWRIDIAHFALAVMKICHADCFCYGCCHDESYRDWRREEWYAASDPLQLMYPTPCHSLPVNNYCLLLNHHLHQKKNKVLV
eukprot:9821478-Ditylum_brightwellii.AAC.1